MESEPCMSRSNLAGSLREKMAYEKGLIKETMIGPCKVRFFDIWDVVSIYEHELKTNPYELWGIKRG